MPDKPGRERAQGRGWATAAMVAIVLLGLLALTASLYAGYWERRLEAKLAEYTAAGQPVTWEDVLDRHWDLPDEENSALILLEAFWKLEQAEEAYGEHVIDRLVATARLGTQHSGQLLGILSTHASARAEALELIHEAARLPSGSYPIPTTKHPFAVSLDYLEPLREAGLLCAREAIVRAAAGDGEAASRSLGAGFRVAASVGDWPLLSEAIARFAVDQQTLDAMERSFGLCNFAAAQVRALRDELAKEGGEVSLKAGILAERAMGHYLFTRASREELAAFIGRHREWKPQAMAWVYERLPGWRARDALFYFNVMDGRLEACDAPARQRYRSSRRAVRRVDSGPAQRRTSYFLTATFMPSAWRTVHEEARTWVGLRVAHAALAAEEWRLSHGEWPDALEQLAPRLMNAVPEDPFSQGKVRYERTESGITVYSIGADRKDNGGISRGEAQRLTGSERRPLRGFDLRFRLLNPELRGAETMSFREELLGSGVKYYDLDQAGFTREKLLGLGLAEPDLHELGFPLPSHRAAAAKPRGRN